MTYAELEPKIDSLLQKGTVIPAHPLALNAERKLDESRQRGLTRYYLAAGAGGVAVGVHTTQFEIREREHGLLEPVLRLAAEEIDAAGRLLSCIKVAGICGPTAQAVAEADLARRHGYHLGLVSMGGLGGWSENDLLQRIRRVAEVIPIFGFYLQPAVGGRVLSFGFWREFAEIPNVCAIKIAAFNRYHTIDVVRAVAESDRRDEIALYTGNDDNIVNDLLTPFRFQTCGRAVEKRIVGGLLGHWAVWTSRAVELLEAIHRLGDSVPARYLSLNAETTDANAVIFDAANAFRGCIPGIHEVLRRQGLLAGIWCLNPAEALSEGQIENIDRIYRDYPHLNDDEFVRQRLDSFLQASR
jgi:dihydrodipicolinate synthase/N-acetylneuraminate lyase